MKQNKHTYDQSELMTNASHEEFAHQLTMCTRKILSDVIHGLDSFVDQASRAAQQQQRKTEKRERTLMQDKNQTGLKKALKEVRQAQRQRPSEQEELTEYAIVYPTILTLDEKKKFIGPGGNLIKSKIIQPAYDNFGRRTYTNPGTATGIRVGKRWPVANFRPRITIDPVGDVLYVRVSSHNKDFTRELEIFSNKHVQDIVGDRSISFGDFGNEQRVKASTKVDVSSVKTMDARPTLKVPSIPPSFITFGDIDEIDSEMVSTAHQLLSKKPPILFALLSTMMDEYTTVPNAREIHAQWADIFNNRRTGKEGALRTEKQDKEKKKKKKKKKQKDRKRHV